MWFQNDSQKTKVYLLNLPDFEIEMNLAEFISYFYSEISSYKLVDVSQIRHFDELTTFYSAIFRP